MKLRVTKQITPENSCAKRVIEVGEVIHEYCGCTYGCISHEGIAASEDGETPFFEVPLSHVEEVA